jgi:hypothetical protein
MTLAAASGVRARVKRCQVRCSVFSRRAAMAGPISSRLPSSEAAAEQVGEDQRAVEPGEKVAALPGTWVSSHQGTSLS